jgi:hypothetical protein
MAIYKGNVIDHVPYALERMEDPSLGDVGYMMTLLPREVTCMVTDEEAEDADKFATAIHYSIDVETRNHNITAGEREALRHMLQDTLADIKAKLAFLIDKPENVIARAYVSTTNSGRRELFPQE